MFNTISWQEFLSAITVVAGGYYIVVMLLLYGNEITTIFRQKEPKPILTEVNEDQNDSNDSILMGGIKTENSENVPHENVVESSEVSVQQSSEAEQPVESRDLLADAFQELRNEIGIVAAGFSSGNADDSVLLLKSLLLHYPQLIQTEYEEKINHLIGDLMREKQVFHFAPNDIKSWWTELEMPQGTIR